VDNDDFEYLVQWCPRIDSKKEEKFPLIIDMPVWGLEIKKESPFIKIAERIVSFFLSGEKSKYSQSTIDQMNKELVDGVVKILQQEDYPPKNHSETIVAEDMPVTEKKTIVPVKKKGKSITLKTISDKHSADNNEKTAQGELPLNSK